MFCYISHFDSMSLNAGFPTALEVTSTDLDIETRTYRLIFINTESKQRVQKSVRFIIKEASKTRVFNNDYSVSLILWIANFINELFALV